MLMLYYAYFAERLFAAVFDLLRVPLIKRLLAISNCMPMSTMRTCVGGELVNMLIWCRVKK